MILDQIAQKTKQRVEQQKERVPLSIIKKDAERINTNAPFLFEKKIKKEELAFICEVKKASPSKGIIAQDFPYLSIAKDYQKAGADAISVLTEPDFFLGSDRYLTDIHQTVSLPLLRKDFTIDPYQIYEAKCIGASAVLLIVSLLSKDTLQEYLRICDELGLSALVEAHDEKEIDTACSAGARIIGVNNRNLKNFSVDVGNCTRLRNLVPSSVIFVAESGIQSPEDIDILRQAKVDAVLIGETMMKSNDKITMLSYLKGGKRS